MQNFSPEQLATLIKQQIDQGSSLEQIKQQFLQAGGNLETFTTVSANLNLNNQIYPSLLASVFSYPFRPSQVGKYWKGEKVSLFPALIVLSFTALFPVFLKGGLLFGFNDLSSNLFGHIWTFITFILSFFLSNIIIYLIARAYNPSVNFAKTLLSSSCAQVIISIFSVLITSIVIFYPAIGLLLILLWIFPAIWALNCWVKSLSEIWVFKPNKTLWIIIIGYILFQLLQYGAAKIDFFSDMRTNLQVSLQHQGESDYNFMSELPYKELLTKDGWGAIKVGADREFVESLVGEPEKFSESESKYFPDESFASYYSLGFMVKYSISENKVIGLTFFAKPSVSSTGSSFKAFPVQFEGALNAESTIKDVHRVLGKPTGSLGIEHMPSYKEGFMLSFMDNELETIMFYRPDQ